LSAIRQQVWSLDSELPLYEAATLQSLISESLAQRSFILVLLGAFAVTALLLAAVGIFGVISYLVAQRRSEFGVRMALGPTVHKSLTWCFRAAPSSPVAGCLCGLALSAFASRLLLTSLYRTDWYDPVMPCLVTLLLFVVVLLASWLPARRAAATDPMHALRSE
jgi:ABC-type antimicrobial peptide transport system permease subunit